MAFVALPLAQAAIRRLPQAWQDLPTYFTPGRQLAATVVVGGGALVGVYIAGRTLQAQINFVRSLYNRLVLGKRRREKRRQCKEALEKLEKELQQSKLSEDERDAILALSTPELVKKLQNGELKACDVLEAYQWAALAAHRKTNCLVEPIVEARALALALDEQTTPKGPLHGLPVSLKDCYSVQNYDSTLGLARLIDVPAEEDAALVTLLKQLGAVPFVKTNVPQTMMSIDTCNPIFGQTTTPADNRRTAGGSSGGEAALLGCGGSPLGFGSDIGGSIRVPAHFCGIAGLKGTQGRFSARGLNGIIRGQKLVATTLGPMARDVDSLVLAMQTVVGPEMFKMDSTIPPVPFKTEMYEQRGKLRIGLYTENSVLPTSEPCKRAARMAAEVLQSLGHEIVMLNTEHESLEAWHLYTKSCAGDGGRSFTIAMKDDKIDGCMAPQYTLVCMNNLLKTLLAKICRIKQWWLGAAAILDGIQGVSSVYEWWHHTQDILDFRLYVADQWKSMNLDAVIAPFPMPAMYCGEPMKATGVISHMSFYNLLDFPVGTIPVTKVTEEDEAQSKNYPVQNMWHYFAKKSLSDMVGLPVGVQIVSYPWHEEMCLRVMKELEIALQQAK